MSDGAAFRSTHDNVLQAWGEYVTYVENVRERRKQFADRYDRNLMVNRLGFGHGTRVVGLELFEDDKPGDVVGPNGEWRVPKNRAPVLKPHIRRKAGKAVEAEMNALTQEGPKLPGMPSFSLIGMRSLAPALMLHDDTVWAYWGDDISLDHDGKLGTSQVDTTLWTPIPLSEYYATKEALEATQKETE